MKPLLFVLGTLVLITTNVSAEPEFFPYWSNFRGGEHIEVFPQPEMDGYGYEYVPSVMYDAHERKYKMWFCGTALRIDVTLPGDVIFYSEAATPLGPWSLPELVFQPTYVSGNADADFTCDPSVIKHNGTYYLYYAANSYRVGSVVTLANGTIIMVASSPDGRNWTRLNNGQPIIGSLGYPTRVKCINESLNRCDCDYFGLNCSCPSGGTCDCFEALNDGNSNTTCYETYGAGLPSVSYVDHWFYLFFNDSEANEASPSNDVARYTYVTRSRSPLFPGNSASEVFIEYNGQRYFERYDQLPAGWKYAPVGGNNAQWVQGDFAYHPGLYQWVGAINALAGLTSLVFVDKSMQFHVGATYMGWRYPDLTEGTHSAGPALLRTTHGHLIPLDSNLQQNQCLIPIDIYSGWVEPDAAQPTGFQIPWEADMHHAGQDLSITTRGCGARSKKIPLDYDGDGVSDPVIYRPSEAKFYVNASSAGQMTFAIGDSTSMPIEGDFDGDGIADFAVITHNPSGGLTWWKWEIFLSNSQTWTVIPMWGSTLDQLAIADYDGDGRDDLGVFNASGQWFVRTIDHNVLYYGDIYGNGDELPIPGDWDGDGAAELAVYRTITGPGDSIHQWDVQGQGVIRECTQDCVPLLGDMFRDGQLDVLDWKRTNNTMYWFSTQNPSLFGSHSFGYVSDIPTLGDFNGDGQLDLVLWRPGDQVWQIAMREISYNGSVIEEHYWQWGLPGDLVPKSFGPLQ